MLSVLKKRPLMRTMIAYGFVNVTADALEQNLISKKKVYDLLKTIRVTLVGTILIAPMVFTWIRLTERLLPSKKVTAVLTKVLCDQFLFAPVAITTFYIGTTILERQKELLAEWKQKFLPTWTTGMMFWPIAQAINFRFIPWELKTIYLPCCSLIWTTYLCYMKEKDENFKGHGQYDWNKTNGFFTLVTFIKMRGLTWVKEESFRLLVKRSKCKVSVTRRYNTGYTQYYFVDGLNIGEKS